MADNTKTTTDTSAKTVGVPEENNNNEAQKKMLEKIQADNNKIMADLEKEENEPWELDGASAGGTSTGMKASVGWYNFTIPDWGYKEFAEETDIFRKGLGSLTGEPGWFYFKIFFHFEDNFGLLGNVIIPIERGKGNNTAINFLNIRKDTYKYDNMGDRAIALEKFIKYLSFINCNAPWFFEKISGLSSVQVPLNELTKEKTIEIGCNQDAIDMRLMSLFHLYQYACFDEINMKEIIPRNLRKFNMSIVLFHMPIKYYDTGIHSKSKGSFDYKSLTGGTGNVYGNRMSYKMFTFKGCEFDLESINNALFSGDMNNEKPFSLGKASIKIKYDRVFTHLMNSWEQFMLGPDGYYYEADNNINASDANVFKNRINAIKAHLNAATGDVNKEIYAELVDSTEHHLGHTFIKSGNTIGNINGINVIQFKHDIWRWNSTRGRPINLKFRHAGDVDAIFSHSPYVTGKTGVYNWELVNYTAPYDTSLSNVANSYKNLWDNIKSSAKNTAQQLVGMFNLNKYKNALGF